MECNNIVYSGLCVDFHIHSKYSFRKDGDKINNNTEQNLNILINNMENDKFKIDMFAITDHDYFSYSMYSAAKEFELNGKIKKVIPGIEFSVMMNDENNKEKVIHVICLFNDENDEKIKKMEALFQKDSEYYNYDKENAYSEKKFLEIIEKIGLDVIMIAHQKNSLLSNKTKKNDANSLGKKIFDELLFMEYFEAYEFRSKKNRIYNNISKIEKNDKYEQLRFITGSDCHVWDNYPKVNENDDFIPTYLKCLPTFRGIAMAITDDSRISTINNFFPHNNFVDNISYELNGENKKIALSKGINVIIGDNSVGKSMLLHALTSYSKENDTINKLDNNIKIGYINYLKENNLELKTSIPTNKILFFDSQGEIRNKFTLKSFDSIQFLDSKFPQKYEYTNDRNKIDDELNKFYSAIQYKLNYDKKLLNLGTFDLLLENIETITFVYTPINPDYFSSSELNEIKTQIKRIESSLEKLKTLLKNEPNDIEILKIISKNLALLNDKYNNKILQLKNNKKIGNIIDLIVNAKVDEYNSILTEEETKKSIYTTNCINLKNTIIDLLKEKKLITNFNFPNDKYTISFNSNEYQDYIFYETIDLPLKYNMTISQEYFKDLIASVLSKNSSQTINTAEITNETLLKIINGNQGYTDGLECLKQKIKEKLDSQFKHIRKITQSGKDITQEMSNGFNSQMYFDILSRTPSTTQGIYLIDQPEDDVSQIAIKNNLIVNFKRMAKNRQIILVTHNPQFVVNLDADNIIFIKKANKNIEIINGALEYKDKDVDILKIVSDNLDGGIDSIKKRWKRYEKNIEF